MLDIEFDPIAPKYTDYSDYRVNRRLLGPSMAQVCRVRPDLTMTHVLWDDDTVCPKIVGKAIILLSPLSSA